MFIKAHPVNYGLKDVFVNTEHIVAIRAIETFAVTEYRVTMITGKDFDVRNERAKKIVANLVNGLRARRAAIGTTEIQWSSRELAYA